MTGSGPRTSRCSSARPAHPAEPSPSVESEVEATAWVWTTVQASLPPGRRARRGPPGAGRARWSGAAAARRRRVPGQVDARERRAARARPRAGRSRDRSATRPAGRRSEPTRCPRCRRPARARPAPGRCTPDRGTSRRRSSLKVACRSRRRRPPLAAAVARPRVAQNGRAPAGARGSAGSRRHSRRPASGRGRPPTPGRSRSARRRRRRASAAPPAPPPGRRPPGCGPGQRACPERRRRSAATRGEPVPPPQATTRPEWPATSKQCRAAYARPSHTARSRSSRVVVSRTPLDLAAGVGVDERRPLARGREVRQHLDAAGAGRAGGQRRLDGVDAETQRASIQSIERGADHRRHGAQPAAGASGGTWNPAGSPPVSRWSTWTRQPRVVPTMSSPSPGSSTPRAEGARREVERPGDDGRVDGQPGQRRAVVGDGRLRAGDSIGASRSRRCSSPHSCRISSL